MKQTDTCIKEIPVFRLCGTATDMHARAHVMADGLVEILLGLTFAISTVMLHKNVKLAVLRAIFSEVIHDSFIKKAA